jgi:hypothetical protein
MGRNAGTFAQSDIAFEFASWIFAEFKLYLAVEFQRLKKNEQRQLEWSAKRELSKLNYHIQTDAIKENLIIPELTQAQKSYVYADEADLLNVALFGKAAWGMAKRESRTQRQYARSRNASSTFSSCKHGKL